MKKQLVYDIYGNILDRGIEWTDYTVNPMMGCYHGCQYQSPEGKLVECIAMQRSLRYNKGAMPEGFAHYAFNPGTMDRIGRLKTPAKFYLSNLNEMFGDWVSDDDIREVLHRCSLNDQHTFQILTKNPERAKLFTFPANVWLGVSMPPRVMNNVVYSDDATLDRLSLMIGHLMDVKASVRWLAVEPYTMNVLSVLERKVPDWVVFGHLCDNHAESPLHDSLLRTVRFLKEKHVPVFLPFKINRGLQQFPTERNFQ